MSHRNAKLLAWTGSLLLYGVLGAACIAAVYGTASAQDPAAIVDGVAKAADVAREKDVTWLALVTAIAAIAALVYKDSRYLAAINRLSDAMLSRPCAFLHRNAAGELVLDPKATPQSGHS